MAGATEREYFPLLDSLRGVAAVEVFVAHVAFVLGLGTGVSLADYLVEHVDNYPGPSVVIFFALSGCLLYRPFVALRFQGRERDDSVAAYAIRRAARVLPAYWLALVVTALVLGERYVFTPAGALHFFAFTQDYRPRTFGQGVGPAWSLDVDVAFYVLLPLVVLLVHRLPARSRRQILLTELGMCAVLYLVSTLWQALMVHFLAGRPQSFFIAELTLPGSLDMFVCGMALAILSVALRDVPPGPFRRRVARSPWAPWLVALIAYVLIGQIPSSFFHAHLTVAWLLAKQLRCVIAVGALLPLIFGLSGGGWLRRVLATWPARFLGVVSYGFYLWHVTIMTELEKLGLRGSAGPVVFVIASFLITVAVASASWYLLERPSQIMVRRWLSRRLPDSAPPPTVLALDETRTTGPVPRP